MSLVNIFTKRIVLFLIIAIVATGLDFFAHETLNPFFDDDTSRPLSYYVGKVVAFVIAFLAVDFFYRPIERLLPIDLPRSVVYAITGTLYFAVYYIAVAPAFILPFSSIVLTGLHFVFILIAAKAVGVK